MHEVCSCIIVDGLWQLH